MNSTLKLLISSAVIGVGTLTVANEFWGADYIDKAKDYLNNSYALLEKYNSKEKILETKITGMEIGFQKEFADKKELQEELKNIRSQRDKLQEQVYKLEKEIEDGKVNSQKLKKELDKANSEIDKANSKVSELIGTMDGKDLEKFDLEEIQTIEWDTINWGNEEIILGDNVMLLRQKKDFTNLMIEIVGLSNRTDRDILVWQDNQRWTSGFTIIQAPKEGEVISFDMTPYPNSFLYKNHHIKVNSNY